MKEPSRSRPTKIIPRLSMLILFCYNSSRLGGLLPCHVSSSTETFPPQAPLLFPASFRATGLNDILQAMRDLSLHMLETYDGLAPITIKKLNENFVKLRQAVSNVDNLDVSQSTQIGSNTKAINETNDALNETNRKLKDVEDKLEDAIKKIGAIKFDPLDFMKVGYVWISFDSTSPEKLFGGTWTQLTGNYYLRVGTNTNTGGDNTWTGSHSHTVNSHTHSLTSGYAKWRIDNYRVMSYDWKETEGWNANWQMLAGANSSESTYDTFYDGLSLGGNTGSASPGTSSTSLSVTIEPKYQTVYAWRRVK